MKNISYTLTLVLFHAIFCPFQYSSASIYINCDQEHELTNRFFGDIAKIYEITNEKIHPTAIDSTQWQRFYENMRLYPSDTTYPLTRSMLQFMSKMESAVNYAASMISPPIDRPFSRFIAKIKSCLDTLKVLRYTQSSPLVELTSRMDFGFQSCLVAEFSSTSLYNNHILSRVDRVQLQRIYAHGLQLMTTALVEIDRDDGLGEPGPSQMSRRNAIRISDVEFFPSPDAIAQSYSYLIEEENTEEIAEISRLLKSQLLNNKLSERWEMFIDDCREKLKLRRRKREPLEYDGKSFIYDKQCAICLDDLKCSGDHVNTKCQHSFHPECLAKWVVHSSQRYDKCECPTCKRGMSIKP